MFELLYPEFKEDSETVLLKQTDSFNPLSAIRKIKEGTSACHKSNSLKSRNLK